MKNGKEKIRNEMREQMMKKKTDGEIKAKKESKNEEL
jgi:hypothetical protein